MTSVTLKFDEDKYNEDKRKFVIKMTLPDSWSKKPCSKIMKHYVKKFNESNDDDPIDIAKCRLIVDREAAILAPDAIIGANVRSGDELTIKLAPEHSVHPADVEEAERVRAREAAEAES
jgi:hypothetical protein